MTMHLQVAARTDTGRVRRKNEDAFIAVDLTSGDASTMPKWSGLLDLGSRGLLLAVSDGMGGTQEGEVASALVVSSLAQGLASAHRSLRPHSGVPSTGAAAVTI